AALAWALSLTPPVTMGGYRQFAPVWLVDAHRQVIWQFALDRFAERPLTGWGLGVISSVAGAGNNIPELVGAEFIPSHTHNWIIHILSEAGLVGALPLIAVVLAVPVLLARRWGRDGDPALLVGLCLWVTYWAANLFNFSLWNTWWQGSLIVLIALIVPKSRRPQS
ncbi:MAG TPA: O-antigen ligase family protein, partial [Magnetospirillum sp.]|nr:O-antigen ligase family protein [Magnetospirillum sp.]